MNWSEQLKSFWQNIIGHWLDRPYKTVEIMGELPPTLRKKTLYLVSEDGYLWHASMLCPCSCKETIHLNLLTDERPCWRVEKYPDGAVSLYPSVWRQVGCKSHFWYKKGRIQWCP